MNQKSNTNNTTRQQKTIVSTRRRLRQRRIPTTIIMGYRYNNNNWNNAIVVNTVMTIIALLFIITPLSRASFTLSIEEPGENHCFSFRVPKTQDSDVSGNYDSWSEHEHMEIRASVEKLDGTKNHLVWSSHPGLREETFDVHIPEGSGGKYQLCFKSDHDENVRQKISEQRQKELRERRQQKEDGVLEGEEELLLEYQQEDDDAAYGIEPVTIGFNIRVDPATPARSLLPPEEQGPEAQRAILLMEQIKTIEKSWKNLVDHFDFLRNREAYQISLTQQIESRIIHWSIVEAIIVMTMSVGQVLYWRKFFEQRRYL